MWWLQFLTDDENGKAIAKGSQVCDEIHQKQQLEKTKTEKETVKKNVPL